MRSNVPKIPRLAAAVAVAVAALALAACGGGGGDAVGSVTIVRPASTGSFETDQALIGMGGWSFRPTTTDIDFFGCNVLTESYTAGWRNEANGLQDGGTDNYRSWRACGGGSIEVIWSFVDVPLAPGKNRIVVWAHDDGIGGQAVIEITRVADVSPPQVSHFYPADGLTGVSSLETPMVQFNEPMDPASFSTVDFTLVNVGTGAPVAGSVSYQAYMRSVQFSPAAALQAVTTYRATLSGARDLAGGNLAPPVTWTFTTAP
jgi:hypothetical protein